MNNPFQYLPPFLADQFLGHQSMITLLRPSPDPLDQKLTQVPRACTTGAQQSLCKLCSYFVLCCSNISIKRNYVLTVSKHTPVIVYLLVTDINNLAIVLKELKGLVHWETVALYLGLLKHTIDKIKKENERVDDCKREMLTF